MKLDEYYIDRRKTDGDTVSVSEKYQQSGCTRKRSGVAHDRAGNIGAGDRCHITILICTWNWS